MIRKLIVFFSALFAILITANYAKAQGAQTRSYIRGAIVPDSMPNPDSSGSSSNFFDPDEIAKMSGAGGVCHADSGMFHLGSVRFFPIPFPIYTEEFGWEPIGAISAWRADSANPEIRVSLTSALGYSERERKAIGFIVPSFNLPISSGLTLTGSGGYFATAGTKGSLLGVGFSSRSLEENRPDVGGSLQLFKEEYESSASLNSSHWVTGKRTRLNLTARWSDASVERPIHNITLGLEADLGTKLLSGNFVHRKLLLKLAKYNPYWYFWVRLGGASGNVPVQELFDIASDAKIRSLPLRLVRSKLFAASGIDTRIHVAQGIFIGGFGTVVWIDKQNSIGGNPDHLEFGLSLSDGERAYNDSHSWNVRIDLPFYSSHGDLASRREKWDFRRFMVRVDFPVPSFGKEKEIRYRYPN